MQRAKCKSKNGFTLIEAVTALGLWLLLSAGVLFTWWYATAGAFRIMDNQSGLENARVVMDSILMNIQSASGFTLTATDEGVLISLTLQIAAAANPPVIRFNPDNAQVTYSGNELAYGIHSVTVVNVNNTRLDVSVTTACNPPIILHGSADIRYKTINYFSPHSLGKGFLPLQIWGEG